MFGIFRILNFCHTIEQNRFQLVLVTTRDNPHTPRPQHFLDIPKENYSEFLFICGCRFPRNITLNPTFQTSSKAKKIVFMTLKPWLNWHTEKNNQINHRAPNKRYLEKRAPLPLYKSAIAKL